MKFLGLFEWSLVWYGAKSFVMMLVLLGIAWCLGKAFDWCAKKLFKLNVYLKEKFRR